jgi:hypothetical protein
MIISLSMRFSGMLSRWERDPNHSRVSFRFCMSVLFAALINGAVK